MPDQFVEIARDTAKNLPGKYLIVVEDFHVRKGNKYLYIPECKNKYLTLSLKSKKCMAAQVDMNYRFTWDTEPTEEQLQVIMQEVGEKVRSKNAQLHKIIKEQLLRTVAETQLVYQKAI
jgi:hypothetical protein